METAKEVWLPIIKPIDLSNRYEVSNYGNIRRIGRFSSRGVKKIVAHSPIKIAIFKQKRRYLSFRVNHNGKYYALLVHRLVAFQFIPNPEKKPQINHIDANKHNNYVLNLEWATQSENIRHAQSLGIFPCAKPKEDRPLKKPGRAKGYKGIFKKVINIETGEIYESTDLLCQKTGLSKTRVSKQLRGDRYCHLPYRYLGQEDKVRVPPLPKSKKEKPPKKERPPRKVYVPHPKVLKKILQFDLNGNMVRLWDSVNEAAMAVNSKPTTFRKAIKKSPENFTKGYIWKYA